MKKFRFSYKYNRFVWTKIVEANDIDSAITEFYRSQAEFSLAQGDDANIKPIITKIEEVLDTQPLIMQIFKITYEFISYDGITLRRGLTFITNASTEDNAIAEFYRVDESTRTSDCNFEPTITKVETIRFDTYQ